MDFTPELAAFQGVIISADNVHSFGRLKERGGNEEQIHYVVQTVRKFLEQENYISQNGITNEQQVRKFAFYLILNANLDSLQRLVEYEGIESIIWTIPTVQNTILSELLWTLHMERFVYDGIAFISPPLSLDLGSALIDNIKYCTPSESLEKLKIISTAIYRQICRYNFFILENDVLSDLLSAALGNFQTCLNFFYDPPKSHHLANLRKDELYKFKGDSLRTMFHVIDECISQFTNIQQFAPPEFNEIYLLSYKIGTYKDDPLTFPPCNNPVKPILECLEKCNEMLLDICKVLVMGISVDIFCAWSEFEEDGKTMQQNIGELCYNIRTKLMSVNVLSEHPVVNMIQQISRKPVEICELIKASDSDTIVANIMRNDANSIEWLKGLPHKDKVCCDVALLEQLSSKLNFFDEDECYNLYKICKTHLNIHSDNADNVKSLAIKAFQRCKTHLKYQIMEEHFSNNCFNNSMETTEFNEMLIEIFNKFFAENQADLSDVLTVFFQNPQMVFTKIFNLSAESSQQRDLMLRVMSLLKIFSDHYYNEDTEACIIRVAETVLEDHLDNEATQQNLINFICGLKKCNIIPETKLLLLIIMPKLHKALKEKDVSCIHFQCKLLSEAFTLEELLPYRAPMLAMIAQILEVVRWKITTFIAESPRALELALQLQIKLFDTYEGGIPAKEENWLKCRLRTLHPLNCYYYKKLWNPSGRNFVEIVSGKSIDLDTDATQLISWLSQVLCTTTQREWLEIWDSLTVFNDNNKLKLIHEAIQLLTAAESANREENRSNSWECLLNCYRNFVYITRYNFFKEPLTDHQVTIALTKIISTANLIREEHTEQFSTSFLPLLAYIAGRKADFRLDPVIILSGTVKNKAFKDFAKRIFTNGTA
ncbi:uncharacterized protein LOC126375244 [Pectinophora gossypiella]|uniref:uncharacterized protein LOC126375244 n=1 Tax=Pectinophora gossypiella TaxID=13191 RepID=UPI00214F16EF|nr:uncharacterized protein LOC126375244 [Pectinophora gossypiella]